MFIISRDSVVLSSSFVAAAASFFKPLIMAFFRGELSVAPEPVEGPPAEPAGGVMGVEPPLEGVAEAGTAAVRGSLSPTLLIHSI